MKLEDQVCSLELAKKLKEIGVKQKSIFVWEYYDDKCYGVKFIPYAVIPDTNNKFQLFSAFTVADLGKMLPHYVDIKTNEPFNGYRISIEKFIYIEGIDYFPVDAYKVNYYCGTSEITDKEDFFRTGLPIRIWDINLANALAKMLIYLLENKLMKVPE